MFYFPCNEAIKIDGYVSAYYVVIKLFHEKTRFCMSWAKNTKFGALKKIFMRYFFSFLHQTQKVSIFHEIWSANIYVPIFLFIWGKYLVIQFISTEYNSDKLRVQIMLYLLFKQFLVQFLNMSEKIYLNILTSRIEIK
jgi:hypothetical protein